MALYNFKDLTGKTFGRLTVDRLNKERTSRGQLLWDCTCSCGNTTTVLGNGLKCGDTRSCGCLALETRTKHSMYGAPEYRTWDSMIQRCTNPKNDRYHRYGGRGILVCSRWKNSFSNFLSDMGHKPSPQHSIDRINNNSNYEPSNCRWATKFEQANNTSRLRLFYATSPIGRRYIAKNQSAFAREHNINKKALNEAISGRRPYAKHGWSFQYA